MRSKRKMYPLMSELPGHVREELHLLVQQMHSLRQGSSAGDIQQQLDAIERRMRSLLEG